jgi:hypothetical protein
MWSGGTRPSQRFLGACWRTLLAGAAACARPFQLRKLLEALAASPSFCHPSSTIAGSQGGAVDGGDDSKHAHGPHHGKPHLAVASREKHQQPDTNRLGRGSEELHVALPARR